MKLNFKTYKASKTEVYKLLQPTESSFLYNILVNLKLLKTMGEIDYIIHNLTYVTIVLPYLFLKCINFRNKNIVLHNTFLVTKTSFTTT